MKVRKFALTDVTFGRLPGQDGDVFVCNVVDQRQSAPISIGFGAAVPVKASPKRWPSTMSR